MTLRDLRQAPFVLLDDSRRPHKAGRSVLFHSPEEIICARTLPEVGPALARMDACLADGYHLAGGSLMNVPPILNRACAPA